MNEMSPIAAAAAASEIVIAGDRRSAAAIMADTTMTELVTLGRLFWAAINSRPGYTDETAERMDEEGDVLAAFDDELTSLICARQPRGPEEYGVKAAYLFARIRKDGMSDAVEDEALEALERDARVMAGLPPILSTANHGDDE